MKTLTDIGLNKQAQRFADSIHHAAYNLDGVPQTRPIFMSVVEGDIVRIYVYFDDTVVGSVSNVQLVDNDGDVVALTDRVFTKPQSKGLYVAFKYRFTEMEVESVESL